MTKKKTIAFLALLLTGVLVVTAAFGVLAVRSVSAAALRQTSSDESGTKTQGKVGRGMGGGVTSQQLADALGITVEQLNTAYQTANQAALDQAVQQGLITQAQADELQARGAAFPFGGRWSGWLSQNGIDYQALLADALGITVEQLNAAYLTAYNAAIDQAVADGRLTQEQADLMKGQYALKNNQNFQTAMKDAFEAAVNQAVTEGVITQAQADQILANQNDMGLHGFGGAGLGGDFGFGGGRGHHGGGFGRGSGLEHGAPAVPSEPTTPSTTPSGSSGL